MIMDILCNISVLCYVLNLSVRVWSKPEGIFKIIDFLKEFIDKDRECIFKIIDLLKEIIDKDKMNLYTFVRIILLYCLFKTYIKFLKFTILYYSEKLSSESEYIYENFVFAKENIEENNMNFMDGFSLMFEYRKNFKTIKSKFKTLYGVFKVIDTFDKNTSFKIRIN